ncbi:SecD/SecF fusion protein [Oikeobacillus pervagus]|uniref:Multifunctional fusion protein n=1 Tax=Oikeobacillus pervagus TaxID=1325931 RepID=A0AAJ1SY25_9BACI|nr:protein translocase subunit SecDF [Oikeobacillus pervagus]MDQ0214589.1 SecD/SecF fusion protein [Oikeobacillus pervagus]
MVKRSRIVAFFLIVLLIGSAIGVTTKDIVNNIKLGLDLQGGFEVLYEVKPAKEGQKITDKVVASTANALEERINVLGVSEPSIQIEEGHRIRVQLAGVEDQNEARKILSTQANLSFRDVDDNLMLDGSDLVQGAAKQSFTQEGSPNVALKLKDRKKFEKVTEKIVSMAPNNQLVIWLDFEEGKDSFKKEVAKENPKFLSSPNVNEVFTTDEVTIEGDFTVEEASNLAGLLNAGSLPVKLKEIYSTSVGAQFGEQALDKTVLSGIIGIALIFLFMLFYYRLPGFIATITLSIYIYLILLVFDWMNGVLTLPGIAALILGVGMAVDANIITYERIKEEIRVGRTIKSAFQAGNKNSFLTILDANITTILAGAVLFYFGTSSVRGFATMLIISILVSFLTAVWGSRLFLGLFVKSGLLRNKPGWFGVKKSDIHDIKENVDTLDLTTRFDKFDFVKHHRKFFAFSIIAIVAGMIVLGIFRLNLGIDFSSGTRMEILAEQQLSKEAISTELEKVNLSTDDIIISGEKKNIGTARFKDVLSKNEIAHLKNHFKEQFGNEPNVSTVSPIIGKELAKNAMKALAIAAVGIIIYVAIRFEFYMGASAVIALIHDAFFIIAIFSLTRLEVDITFIAAILTIIGYSINDTIVTFDRIRENLEKKRRIKTYEELADIVNKSLRQTLTRSINTVLTVIVTVIALLIFGSESIRNFSIALLIGLISGTYSSLFIAAQLWLVWKGKELKRKGSIKTYKEKKTWSDEPQV